MKTVRIVFLLILTSMLSFQSYSQEAKKESKAKFRMEVIDADGNKKVVDTSFTVESDQDFNQVVKNIHSQMGLSEEKMAKMKGDFKDLFEHFDVDVEMNQFDKDSLRKHMFIVREEMQNGKERMQNRLEELREEVENLEMNEVALQKLEQAMEELHHMDWAEHAQQMKDRMRAFKIYNEETIDFFNEDGKDWVKQVWVDDKDGEKRIIIKTEIDGDSLVWNVKDAKKHHLKTYKHGGNVLFFGDDEDLEVMQKGDGNQKVIIRKMKDEAQKGDALFISDDAHIVKEFKDKDGQVKVVEYRTSSDGNDDKELNVWVSADGKRNAPSDERRVFVTAAKEKDIEKARNSAVINPKNEVSELDNLNLNIDNDIISLGTQFEEKKKVDIKLYDADFNPLWEAKGGRVVGEWSTTLPTDKLKEKGKYYVLINHGNNSHLLNLMIR